MTLNQPLAPRWSTASIPGAPDALALEISSLSGHVDACRASQGRWFGMHCLAESAHGFVAPRFVTSLVALCFVVGVASLAF